MNRTHIIFCSVSLGYRKKSSENFSSRPIADPWKAKKENPLLFGTGGAKQGSLTRCSFILLKLEIREFSGVVLRLNF